MENFDFNIQNYSNSELEELLGISNMTYNATDVISNKQNLCVQLLSTMSPTSSSVNNLGVVERDKMSDFLDAASKCLISGLASTASSSSSLATNYYSPAHNFPKNTIIPGSESDGHFIIADAYRMSTTPKGAKGGGAAAGAVEGGGRGLAIGDYGAPPGVINPVKYSTIVTSVNIDSRFRPNYFNSKSTDLHITLPERIDNVLSYRVGAIEIPFYAIYTISELIGNNAIQILWGTAPETYTNTLTIVIPDGNYYTTNDSTNITASASIANTINTILDSNTGTNGISGLLHYYVDQISGKSVFAQPTGATPISFKVVVNIRSNGISNYEAPLLSFLGWHLGFRSAEYVSNNGTAGTGAGSVVSEALLAFKAASYIFISIDDYNNSVNDYYSAVFSDSYAIKNVITRLNIGMLREISEASSTQLNRQRNFFGPVNIQKLRITLYDNFGRIVDLNNMDWNMELIFECIYN